MTTEQAAILEAIRALPRDARARLVEQLQHELAAEGVASGESVIGLFAHEPDLIAQVCQGAMDARERHPLRAADK